MSFLAGAVSAQPDLFHLGGIFPVGKGAATQGATDGFASSVVIGDFNRDGKPDVVTANLADSTISLLWGDGFGGLSPAPGSPIKIQTGVAAIAAADFNADGNPDLIVLGYSGNAVLLGDGKGGFTPGAGVAPASNGLQLEGTSVVVADFNGDGKPDLFSQLFTQAFFAMGDGTGGFTTVANPVGAKLGPFVRLGLESQIAAGDFNGDGISDVAVAGADSSDIDLTDLHVYLTGQFSSDYGAFDEMFSVRRPATFGVATGDFNGDGRLDAITSASSVFGPYVTAWLATGDWSTLGSGFQSFITQVSSTLTSLVVADFNGDGHLDWAGINGNGQVLVGLGDGKGGFAAAPGSPYQAGDLPFALAAGDLNGDGKPDLVVDTGSAVVVLLNSVEPSGPRPQVITFLSPYYENMSPATVTLSATASSGLPVTFTSNSEPVCTVSGNVLTLVNVGTCSITAGQAGNSAYTAAFPVTRNFPVDQGTQTITFPSILSQAVLGAAPVSLSATASSGLPIQYSLQSTTACTVSGNTLSFVAAGRCDVTAAQPGNQNYAAAFALTQTVLVYLPQTITFGPLPDLTLAAPSTLLAATASSSLPVAFASNTPGVCTISESTANLIGAGLCSITASQSGDQTYAPAFAVTRSFTVTALQPQSIAFPAIPNQSIGAMAALAAAASSGLPVAYASTTPAVCSVSGGSVTAESAGVCSITASQNGDSTFAPAAPVTQAFVVVVESKAQQTITFNAIADHPYSLLSFPLIATASSALPVSFSSNTPTVCAVNLSSTYALAPGTCSITASQPGNAAYNPAIPVTRTFRFQAPVLPAIAAVENAASYALGPLAPGSYGVIFGANLANANDTYTFVSFQDQYGRNYEATIIYAGPRQIDFLVPDDLPAGIQKATLTSTIGTANFTATISPISPGLFTVDTSATMPAAQVVTGEPDGTQSFQLAASCNGANCTLVPITLDPSAPTYLVLYGTGIRGRVNVDDVTVSIGGFPAELSYAGAQGGFPGLDQVNVLIPPALAGNGLTNVALKVSGFSANAVQIMIR